MYQNTIRTGDWWRGYGVGGALAARNFVHCLATHMYYTVQVGDEPGAGHWKGYTYNRNFELEFRAQGLLGEYDIPMMQWWHCRYNLSFACEGTVTDPKSYYGYKP